VAPLTVLLVTHFLSLQYLPAIGAGASVRLTRLRSREQINKQNIDNFECFGVKFVKIYPEMTSQ
jgi:hypothetical protein